MSPCKSHIFGLSKVNCTLHSVMQRFLCHPFQYCEHLMCDSLPAHSYGLNVKVLVSESSEAHFHCAPTHLRSYLTYFYSSWHDCSHSDALGTYLIELPGLKCFANLHALPEPFSSGIYRS